MQICALRVPSHPAHIFEHRGRQILSIYYELWHCTSTCNILLNLHKHGLRKKYNLEKLSVSHKVAQLPRNNTRIWPDGLDTKSVIWTSCLFTEYQTILCSQRISYFSWMHFTLYLKYRSYNYFLNVWGYFSNYITHTRKAGPNWTSLAHHWICST